MFKLLFLIIAVGMAGIFGNYIQNAEMNSVTEILHNSLGIISNPTELGEIHSSVNDFIELRKDRYSSDANLKAAELDQRLNDLRLVQTYCEQKISTLDLAFNDDPYGKLQQMCPILKNFSFSKAAQLFGQFDK